MGQRQKIFIAEDNVIISEQLKDILEELGYAVLDIGFDLISSIGILSRSSPDIALLDIRMHGKNVGFEIAEYVNEHLNIPIVFLTSYSDGDTVGLASKYDPAAYLLKPFRKEQIFSSLAIVSAIKPIDSKKITLNLGREKRIVSRDEILWLKTDDKYIEIQTNTRKYVVRSSISTFMTDNQLEHLERVHRSYAVNPAKIDAVHSSHLLILGHEIPISRQHVARIQAIFK